VRKRRAQPANGPWLADEVGAETNNFTPAVFPAMVFAPTFNRRQSLGLLLAVAALAAWRLWRLPDAGPPDYDSVHNWQLTQELAAGHFQNLFINGSPGFRLLFVPLAWAEVPFWVYQLVNALLSVVAAGWFGWFVVSTSTKETSGNASATWAPWEIAALVLLAGTGLLLSFSGRDFTGSSLSLLACVGVLSAYYKRLQSDSSRWLRYTAGWLAFGLCVSYKFLLLLPILLVLELLRGNWVAWRGGTWQRVLGVLALPYVMLGAVGWLAAHLPWYRWLAVYYRQVVPAAPNLAGRQATIRPDLSYYFRYLLEFESPLLLVGLVVGAGILLRQGLRRGQAVSLLTLLTLWSGCLLLGMSLLVKAPRGLLFAYLPLAALAVLSLRQLLPRTSIRMAVLGMAIGLNLFRGWTQLYRYPLSNYPQVAAWLRAQGATRIVSTVGMGIAPYLGADQQLRVATNEKQLVALHRQGYQFVVLDGYWRVAGVAKFDSLRRQVPLSAWPEPGLAAPLLFLEHSEYTGLGYVQTLSARQHAAADSLPLRVYRLR
jgi:hypothetical protein